MKLTVLHCEVKQKYWNIKKTTWLICTRHITLNIIYFMKSAYVLLWASTLFYVKIQFCFILDHLNILFLNLINFIFVKMVFRAEHILLQVITMKSVNRKNICVVYLNNGFNIH